MKVSLELRELLYVRIKATDSLWVKHLSNLAQLRLPRNLKGLMRHFLKGGSLRFWIRERICLNSAKLLSHTEVVNNTTQEAEELFHTAAEATRVREDEVVTSSEELNFVEDSTRQCKIYFQRVLEEVVVTPIKTCTC